VWASGALLSGCGPDDRPQQTCSSKPDFVVTVHSELGLLPEDTLISVVFGGEGHETYRPNGHNARQVLFCEPTRSSVNSAAGAGGVSGENHAYVGGAGGEEPDASAGEAGSRSIRAIGCELWTGGPALLTVQADPWMALQQLTPKDEVCTVWYDVSLGLTPSKP
jgi:hypothetical protein